MRARRLDWSIETDNGPMQNVSTSEQNKCALTFSIVIPLSSLFPGHEFRPDLLSYMPSGPVRCHQRTIASILNHTTTAPNGSPALFRRRGSPNWASEIHSAARVPLLASAAPRFQWTMHREPRKRSFLAYSLHRYTYEAWPRGAQSDTFLTSRSNSSASSAFGQDTIMAMDQTGRMLCATFRWSM